MRKTPEVAQQFLAVRERYQRQLAVERELERADITPHDAAIAQHAMTPESASAAELEREMCALAWVLGVDPDIDTTRLQARTLMQQIAAAEAEDAPTRVTLSAIRRYPQWLWLVEFPACVEPGPNGYTSNYWSAFIAPRQLRELGAAIAKRFGSLGGDRGSGRHTKSLGAYLAAERTEPHSTTRASNTTRPHTTRASSNTTRASSGSSNEGEQP